MTFLMWSNFFTLPLRRTIVYLPCLSFQRFSKFSLSPKFSGTVFLYIKKRRKTICKYLFVETFFYILFANCYKQMIHQLIFFKLKAFNKRWFIEWSLCFFIRIFQMFSEINRDQKKFFIIPIDIIFNSCIWKQWLLVVFRGRGNVIVPSRQP